MPNKKICPLHNSEYDEGSFSDIIHRYIYAETKEELDVIKGELQTPERFNEIITWTNGVVSEFVPHFKDRLKKTEIDSDQWHLDQDKLNWMGYYLGVIGAQNSKTDISLLKWAETIYKSYYGILCDLQESKGRLHKGTPLHQMGWVRLLDKNKDSQKKSEFFMTLAMLEDALSDPTEYQSMPAFRVLSGEHAIPEDNLKQLANYAITCNSKNGIAKCQRPEILFLEYIINRTNKTRSRICDLDHGLANGLLNAAKTATANHEKGKTLERFLAYMFASCEGFEVQRNLKGFDSEIDLLVRNLNTSDPIMLELGKYVLVESKNIKDKVDAKTIRNFAQKIIHSSCSSGVIISKNGLTNSSASDDTRNARLAILKASQRQGIIIIPLTLEQFMPIIEKKASLIDVLVYEYENIRFDLK